MKQFVALDSIANRLIDNTSVKIEEDKSRETLKNSRLAAQIQNMTRIGTGDSPVDKLLAEYAELYKIKEGPVPGTFKWAPNDQDRQRLQNNLLGIQDEMIKSFIDDLTADDVDLKSQYEHIARTFNDTRDIIFLKHFENKNLTKTHINSLAKDNVTQLELVRKNQNVYVNELTLTIEESDLKLSQAKDMGSVEMTMLLNSRINKGVDRDARRKIRDILQTLINHQTISLKDYRFLVSNLKDEKREFILECAKRMVEISPGVKKINEQVDADHSHFTAESLTKLIQSIAPYVSRLTIPILSRVLPGWAIVSYETWNADNEMEFALVYKDRVYDVIDILSGKHNDVELFEEISKNYLTLLGGLKQNTLYSLNESMVKINQLIVSYQQNPTFEIALNLIHSLHQYKLYLQDYSRVFNADDLDQEDILYRLFSDNEKSIKYHIGNNDFDSPVLIKAVEGFSHLNNALIHSKHPFQFQPELDRTILSTQAYASAKMLSDIHRLGVVDYPWILPTLKRILKFDQFFREGFSQKLKPDWEDIDRLIQHCFDRILSNLNFSKREQGRLLSDEMADIINHHPYKDLALRAFHHLIFAYSQTPLKILSIDEVIGNTQRSNVLGREIQDAILSVIHNHPSVIEINFGRFCPDEDFISRLMNENEHIGVYRFGYKPNLNIKVSDTVFVHQFENAGTVKYYRSRLKYEDTPLKPKKSFFTRTEKSKLPAGLIEQFKQDPLKLFASLEMNPKEVYKELIAVDAETKFSEFNGYALSLYDSLKLNERFAQAMVLLACEDIKSDMKTRTFASSVSSATVSTHISLGLAARWLDKIPVNSLLFIKSAFDYFMLCPADTFKTEAALWKKFITALKKHYSILLHTDYHMIFMKLLKFSPEIVSNKSLLDLFASYLRALELMNEYSNEFICDNHYQILTLLFNRQDLVENILKLMRLEAVYSADYSLRSPLNSRLVEHIQEDFAVSRFPNDFPSFERDMSILVANPPATNPQAFLNGLNYYLQIRASFDIDFNQKLDLYVSHVLSNKMKIPDPHAITLLNQIGNLPREKLKQAEGAILKIVALILQQHADIKESHEYHLLSDFEIAIEKFKVNIIEKKLKKLIEHFRQYDEDWIDVKEDARIPSSMRAHPAPCKLLYLYFVEKQEVASSSSSSYFSNHYDSLLKQTEKLNVLMVMLDRLKSLPWPSTDDLRKSIYHMATDALRQIDLKPASILSYSFSQPTYKDTSIMLMVKSLRQWSNQNVPALNVLGRELKTHYGRILEQMVNICLKNMPSSRKQLEDFLTKAAQGSREKSLIEARSTSAGSLSFSREIDVFFQKLSDYPEILNQSTAYTIKKLAQSLSVDGVASANLQLVNLCKV